MDKRWFLPLCFIALLLMSIQSVFAEKSFRPGVVYFALNNDASTVEQDLIKIKELGYKNIKLPTWAWTTPTPGSELEKWVLMFLDKLAASGLRLTLLNNVQYGGEVSPVDAYLSTQIGREVDPEERVANCFIGKNIASPPKTWARLLSDVEMVDGIILGNEVGPVRDVARLQDQRLIKAYQDFLIKEHGSLAGINEAWGTSYSEISQINLEPLESNHPSKIDVVRFTNKLFADFYNHLFEEHIKPIMGQVDYSVKTSTDPFIQSLLTACNVAGWDDVTALYPQWRIKAMTDVSGKVGYNSEMHLYHDFYKYAGTPAKTRYRYFVDSLNGSWWTESFDYNDWTKNITSDGVSLTEQQQATKNTILDITRVLPELRCLAEAPPLISVILTEANYYLEQAPDNAEITHPALLYCGLAARGLPWKFVAERNIAEIKTPYIILWTERLNQEALKALVALPSSQQIIVLGEVPTKDEYGQNLPDLLVAALRNRSTLLNVQDPADVINKLSEIAPEYGKRAGIFLEAGRQNMLGWSSEKGHYNIAIPYPKVEVRQAKMGTDYVVVIINHMEESQSIPIPQLLGNPVPPLVRKVIDLIKNEEVSGPLTLQPFEVRLFQYKL